MRLDAELGKEAEQRGRRTAGVTIGIDVRGDGNVARISKSVSDPVSSVSALGGDREEVGEGHERGRAEAAPDARRRSQDNSPAGEVAAYAPPFSSAAARE
jgi:hypothetical protein